MKLAAVQVGALIRSRRTQRLFRINGRKGDEVHIVPEGHTQGKAGWKWERSVAEDFTLETQ